MASTTIADILAWVAARTGRALFEDEGVQFGPAERDLTGATVCWMPDPPAMRAAAAAGHEVLLHHEALTFPYPGLGPPIPEAGAWPTNAARRAALEAGGLTAVRIHESADLTHIYAEFVRRLGLGEPTARGGGLLQHVFEIEPTPYEQLIERVKAAAGLPGVRATCCTGPDRTIRRVGLPWGGLGLFTNVRYQQALLELGVDAMIAGESDSYGMRFVTEGGVDLIETSHEASEEPGLARWAADLAGAFPGLDVHMHEQGTVWQVW